MRKIVQATIFLLAFISLAATVTAESDGTASTGKSEVDEGRDVYPFKPAVGSELIVDNPLLEEKPSLTYTVQPGDNLYRIAIAHKVPLQSLMEWNGLVSELIHPGDVLNVSVDAPGSVTNMKKMKSTVAAAPVTKKESKVVPAAKQTVSTKTASVPAKVPVSARELTMTATAYTAYCNGCSGTTKIGIDLRANPNQKVIAVDPSIIPLGSRVWVEGYGEAVAGDTGGAIKGHKIDVFIPGVDSALAWGVKKVRVKILK